MRIKNITVAFAFSLILTVSLGMTNVWAAPEVIDFELEIELKDNTKYDIEYEVRGDMFEAEYQVPGEPTIYGEDAKAMIEPLLQELALTPDANKKELEEQILSFYRIDKNN